MPTPIQLLVGLGNPGAKYAATRHNAGAWFIEGLAKRAGTTLRPEPKLKCLHAQANFEGRDCHLMIPSTYMNESGLAVRLAANYYKIPTEAILIVHDEIDLPPGIAQLKLEGGSGGHNGLKDIIEHLNTKQFKRLRLGVGHPGSSEEVVDYVLNSPSKAERAAIQEAMSRAEAQLPYILEGDFAKAMQVLHSKQ